MTPEDYIRRKQIYPVALTTEQVDALSQDFREASAWIAGQEEARIISTYYEAAAQIAAGHLSEQEAARLVRETLAAAGYQAEQPGSWTDMAHGTARQQLILRTNVNKAAGYAWHEAVKDSAAYPAQRLVRMGARRAPRDWAARWRNAWAALSPAERQGAHPTDMVALTSSRIWRLISRWGDPYPPYDYGSGMDVQPVDYDTAVSLGLLTDEAAEDPEPAGFGGPHTLPAGTPADVQADIADWISSTLS